MEVFFAQFTNSLALGGIYALLVTGFTLLLVVGGVFHYAYPHVVVLSMYICWMALEATGGNIALSILAAIGTGVGVSLLSEPIFRPLIKRGAALTSFFVSLAIGMLITDILARHINAGLPVAFPLSLSGEEAIIKVGIAILNTGQIATILGSIGAVAGLLYLLYRTKLGRALRSMAQSPSSARLLGIPVTRMTITCYLIAGLLGGISSVFLAMSLGWASSILADSLALKVLAAALLAGLGNLRGGLIAAFILGFAETMALAYLPGDWSNVIAFGIIIVVVMFRPQGLFGMRA